MIALLPILAAAALALPDADGEFIRRLDPGASASGRGGVLMAEILVAPDRTIEGCRVLASTYAEAENRRICDQARTMRAAKSAEDHDGNPVYGFVTVARVARAGGASQLPPDLDPPFLELTVRNLSGRDTRKTVYVTTLVDTDGALMHCQLPTGKEAALGQVACNQLAGQSLAVVRNQAGSAVRYARLLKVDFVEESNELE